MAEIKHGRWTSFEHLEQLAQDEEDPHPVTWVPVRSGARQRLRGIAG